MLKRPFSRRDVVVEEQVADLAPFESVSTLVCGTGSVTKLASLAMDLALCVTPARLNT